jgi:SpoVK/Ycf46/Vps4 family AAA+-type ATPase
MVKPFKGSWEVKNNMFRFAKSDYQFLPPGFYIPKEQYPYWYLDPSEVHFDKRTAIKDDLSTQIIESVEKFWEAAEAYKELGAVHKRGIFFYGPPGTGKSVAVNVLCQKVVEKNGVVILVGQNGIDKIEDLMHQVRTSDHEVPIAIVLEDIEMFIRNERERKAILNILSGQRQINNVLYIGTTNLSLEELSKICPALVNRPSRFDIVEYIGYANIAHKIKFLTKYSDKLTHAEAEYIATETPDCSIAHLKEIVISHICLGYDLVKTVERVRLMKIDAPTAKDEDEEDDGDEFNGLEED